MALTSNGVGDNQLIQLAIFNSEFNILGVLIFWPALVPFTRFLERMLPDRPEPRVLIPADTPDLPENALRAVISTSRRSVRPKRLRKRSCMNCSILAV